MESKDGEQEGAREHIRVASEMYDRWQNGEAKSRLEREYLGNTTAHGKVFTDYVKRWIGVDTERRSRQSVRIEELESVLRVHGIPLGEGYDRAEEHRLLANARESAIAAIRIYNDPVARYRTEAFVVLMIGAWNSLLQAMLEQSGIDYYERDDNGNVVMIEDREKVLSTRELVKLALEGEENRPVRANLDFFIGLRNQIAHRYLPALDVKIVGKAQAMLMNFEDILISEFGQEAALGGLLAVPLQLSGFRNDVSLVALRRAQGELPEDVEQYIHNHSVNLEDDIIGSPKYTRRIFFVHTTANREQTADAVVHFVSPEEITPELASQLSEVKVVTKQRIRPVASADLLKPKEVVEKVAERLPFRFTMYTHTKCWKHYGVRPDGGSDTPESTDDRHCRWDRLLGGYGYTEAWVRKIVKELSKASVYEEVVGYHPNAKKGEMMEEDS